jgi:quercetin dioxygenase-like cupin family protein
MNGSRCVPLIAAVLLVNLPSANAGEKAPDAKETVVLQRVPLPGTDREMGMGIAEFPPHAVKPKHKATGPEVAYVLEGEVTVQVEGRPAQVVHAGESYRMPANVVHVTSAGPVGAKVLATWAWVPGKAFNVRVQN